jgi:DNA-binding transcriptional ArsR family regulator
MAIAYVPAMLIKPRTRRSPTVLGTGNIPDPRQEIVEYFRLHPAAADSLEGIVDWWLPLQRYETARAAIQQALDDLVREGIVDEVVRGKTRFYRLSREKLRS